MCKTDVTRGGTTQGRAFPHVVPLVYSRSLLLFAYAESLLCSTDSETMSPEASGRILSI